MATIQEYNKRKGKIITHLGGKCVKCGTADNLQIDHKDHNKKNFSVMGNWGRAWSKLLEELKLCQLLCSKCHLNKSCEEGSLGKGWSSQPRGPNHGTIWAYTRYKCRCQACRQAKSIQSKAEYRKNINSNAG